jgi:hypothetical protein
MRRGLHIALSLMAVLLLAAPFDCFASGISKQKATDCCLKGKCAPTANADDCCKVSVPDAHQLLTSNTASASSPLIAFTVAHDATSTAPVTCVPFAVQVDHPPSGFNLSVGNLPLLI